MIKTETELCKRVVDWLKAQHWEVYQEVSFGRGESRADIVATQGPLVWIIEAKCAMSLALIDQALAWRGYAHLISVVSVKTKRSPRYVMHWICKSSGIGWISVNKEWSEIRVNHAPRLMRGARMVGHTRTKLNEKQKHWARAGSKAEYWSPYTETCREVLSRVREKPGLTMKELMDGLKHHYSSDATARSCLARWAGKNKIRGVRLEREGRLIRLYPED